MLANKLGATAPSFKAIRPQLNNLKADYSWRKFSGMNPAIREVIETQKKEQVSKMPRKSSFGTEAPGSHNLQQTSS